MRRLRLSSRAGWTEGAGLLPLTLAAALAVAVLSLAGCSSREQLNPALRLENEQYERAVERGRSLLAAGADPYQAYTCAHQANQWVTSDVIVQDAVCCWPADEVAFAIVQQGDSSPTAVERAARQARSQVEREIKFSVVLQIPKSMDPSNVGFQMRSSAGSTYPPTAVDTPVYLRDVTTALDPSLGPAALYGYDVHFPIQGSPGYPAIGTGVSSLSLIIKVGDKEVSVPFTIPRKPYRY